MSKNQSATPARVPPGSHPAGSCLRRSEVHFEDQPHKFWTANIGRTTRVRGNHRAFNGPGGLGPRLRYLREFCGKPEDQDPLQEAAFLLERMEEPRWRKRKLPAKPTQSQRLRGA